MLLVQNFLQYRWYFDSKLFPTPVRGSSKARDVSMNLHTCFHGGCISSSPLPRVFIYRYSQPSMHSHRVGNSAVRGIAFLSDLPASNSHVGTDRHRKPDSRNRARATFYKFAQLTPSVRCILLFFSNRRYMYVDRVNDKSTCAPRDRRTYFPRVITDAQGECNGNFSSRRLSLATVWVSLTISFISGQDARGR